MNRILTSLFILLLSLVGLGQGVSGVNSSTSPLLSGEEFIGAGQNVETLKAVTVKVTADRPGLLYLEFSSDGIAWQSLPPYEVDSMRAEAHALEITSKFQRTRFVNNSGEDQAYFDLQTKYGDQTALVSPLNFKLGHDADALVAKTIGADILFIEKKFDGYRINSKFGRNTDVDSGTLPEDVWGGGGIYTGFPTATAEEFQVLSSDAADASAGTGAQMVRIWYLDDDYNMFDSSGDFLFFDVATNGVTPVNSGVTGMRVWRVKVIQSGSGRNNAGIITVRWATTTSVVFSSMPPTFAQSQLSNFTIPEGYTGHLKVYSSSMDDNTSNDCQIVIKATDFGSNTDRLIRPFSVSTGQPYVSPLYGSEVFESKTDFVFRVIEISNNDGIVNVDYEILLSKN